MVVKAASAACGTIPITTAILPVTNAPNIANNFLMFLNKSYKTGYKRIMAMCDYVLLLSTIDEKIDTYFVLHTLQWEED